MSMQSASGIRRYERRHEAEIPARRERVPVVPLAQAGAAIDRSDLSAGVKQLAHGLCELASVRGFPGGGLGIEYGSLLKTAVRPDIIAGHVLEAAAHLLEQQVDVLLVPGMSGYPIGSIYAFAAGIPAVLLKKNEIRPDRPIDYPPGAFVIPSYTGEGDVVMTADPAGVQGIVRGVLNEQLAAQADAAELHFTIRFAGADDIIDKATMSQAVSESAAAIGELAIESFLADYRARTSDTRRTHTHIEVVAWVTPMIKTYNNPQGHLQRLLGITPFAGLEITGLQTDPHAIGISGVGMLALRSDS